MWGKAFLEGVEVGALLGIKIRRIRGQVGAARQFFPMRAILLLLVHSRRRDGHTVRVEVLVLGSPAYRGGRIEQVGGVGQGLHVLRPSQTREDGHVLAVARVGGFAGQPVDLRQRLGRLLAFLLPLRNNALLVVQQDDFPRYRFPFEGSKVE